jgi:Cof subfamily protein (haloacid dehalogenase superfamily)
MPKSLADHTLALDLDGTLLDAQGQISPNTKSILSLLSYRGLNIILASGRMTARVIPSATALEIPLSLITYNGAETLVGQNLTWTSLATRAISNRTRDAVFELCLKEGLFLNVYSEGKLHGYQRDRVFTSSKIYQTQTGAEYAGLHDQLAALPQRGINKLLVVETPENRDRYFDMWFPRLSSHCSLVKSNPEYLEFMDIGVSKGSTLKSWLANKQLSEKNLIAFGDAENDLEMLTLAGLGIAMGNASPGLKEKFPRISAWTNAEEGVARELAKLFNLSLG